MLLQSSIQSAEWFNILDKNSKVEKLEHCLVK